MATRKVLKKLKKHKDNKYLWFLISTGILAGLIYFSDPEKFLQSIRSADPLLLIPALGFGLAMFPAWSYVWYRVFQKSEIHMPYRKAVRIFMAGNFMNAITPLGQAGGEPLMAYLVEQNTDASYERALSSIFSADIMNGMPPITFILGGTGYLLLFGSLNTFIIQTVYMVLLVTAVGSIIAYLLWFESGTIEGSILKITRKISQKTGKGKELVKTLEEKLEKIEESFKAIGSDPKYLLKTSIISHAGWLMQVFNFVILMHALGYNPDFTPVYFVVVISGLANWSPTPGGSGTYEAAMATLVTIFFPQINFATGLTIGILFRLSTYWPGLILGWFALNSLNGEVEKK
ncbi:lysylphosphatidylglycerol synthase transmembrane domain-containing protein [Candidatus Nanohalobium constans]|uniref:Lysylphosphatidylglycerol synthase TM region / glycosyltransferase 2 family protein n=1 Tax=Candidatus Nanohalobium constans TaxID=2565781 RepID=A0A5Q0UGN5_9ARCH|nr:lysylphosphatidylglycerol synthase transmembrane domain-containing protein [Candidatus Nanohalobium constans]QGA80149.1 lysylphosphatidylglycerol synthase TM region / glycosyltransferase 2 family protein [Candidatus Nanohalobium constans]